MKLTKWMIAVAAASLTGANMYADTATVNLSPVADTRVFNVNWGWNQNDGPGGDIGVYQSRDRSLLKFDFTVLPVGATFNSASLTLHTSNPYGGNPNGETMSVYRLTQPWTEGGVTWNTYDNANAWATPGGDFNGTVYASSTANPGSGQPISWDVTTLAQDWFNSTFVNDGLIIINSGTVNGLHFASKENGVVSYRPYMAVSVTTPTTPPGGALTWNSGEGTAGAIDGGGAWTDANKWWNEGLVTWADNSDAIFGAGNGTAGTVSISGSVTPRSLWFQAAGSGTYTLDGGTLNFGGAGRIVHTAVDTTINSTVANGALFKQGAGTLTLTAANSYGGGTAIAAGVVKPGNANALGASYAPVTVSAGAGLDVNSLNLPYVPTLNGRVSATQGALFTTGDTYNSGVPAISLGSEASIGNNGGRFDIGRISGHTSQGNNHVLTKVGNNVIGLLANSTGFAGIVIDGGALQPENDNAFGNAPITVNAAGSLAPWGGRNMGNALTLAGGSVQALYGYNHVYTGPVTAQAGSSSILNANSGNIYLNGNLTGTGTLVKQGANSVFLGGDNSGFSGVYINRAVNTFVNSSTAGSAAAAWVVDSGNLASRITVPSTIQLGSLAGAGGQLGNEQNYDYALNFSVGGNNASTLYNGFICNNMDNVGNGIVSLTKVGTGTLTLTRFQAYSGDTIISNGTLKLSLAVVTAGAARHFDASALSLTNGAAITQWSDLSGNSAHATVPGGNANPTFIADAETGTGLGAVDFRKNTDARDSQALGFTRDTSVRSVFSVFKGASFLLTDNSTYRLHRLSDDNPANALLVDYGQINYLGKVYVNGAEVVNPLADPMPINLHNGYNLVEIVGNGNTMELDSFNKDRVYHSGNQSHAETILFDSVVPEEKRLQIEAYLNNKWFGIGDGPAVTNLLNVGTSVVLGGSGRLDLGHTVQTVTGLSGSGVVTNGTLTATGLVQPGGAGTIGTLTVPGGTVLTGTLQVDVMPDGSCDMLAVQGAAALSSASLTVSKASTLDSTRIYTVLTCTGTPSRFSHVSVPPGWDLIYKNGSVQIGSGGTLIRVF
jgi:autotransporter-associated beta strand protein